MSNYVKISELYPLYYTQDEVKEFLRTVLASIYNNTLTTKMWFEMAHNYGYKIKSMSNNSIQGWYCGIRVDVRTRNSKAKGVILL